MGQTSLTKSRVLSLVALGAVSLTALVYGCSADPSPAPATTVVDAGEPDVTGPADTGPTDTGIKPDTSPPPDAAVPTAVANLQPTSGVSIVTGTATFVQGATSTTVNVTIANAPAGLHGMHIHAGDNCDNVDDGGPGSGAGDHWSLDDAGHGLPDGAPHHTGDMGNIAIDDAGTGSMTLTSSEWKVAPGAASVVGRTIVFHAGQDDGTTQPTGASGGRLGCGVIQQTK